MAIYSCNLKSIGRSTHAPGTAGAHILYISRPDANPVLLSEHMPYKDNDARNWIDMRERGMRKNARVIDKLRIALPIELDEVQRAALVEAFMSDLAKGRVPWFAAIHQTGKDAHNPHAHIAVHDRDIEHGKRALRLSDNARDRINAGLPGPKAVDWIRERWEAVCNEFLVEAGFDARIDRRTLEAQGSDKKPGIHEGPRAQHIEGNIRRPQSKQRINGSGRLIDYPSIDHGRTRREFNAHIIDLNLERAVRSDNPETAIWAQFEKDQSAKDKALEQTLSIERQQQTQQRRSVSAPYLEKIKLLRHERDQKVKEGIAVVREIYVPQREAMRRKQTHERAELKDKQSRLRARLLLLIDITGTSKKRQEEARKLLSAEHRRARRNLTQDYYQARDNAVARIKERYAEGVARTERRREAHVEMISGRHAELKHHAEDRRQQREVERAHASEIAVRKIAEWNRTRKDGGPLGVESSFARAMRRAAEMESRANSSRNGGSDHER